MKPTALREADYRGMAAIAHERAIRQGLYPWRVGPRAEAIGLRPALAPAGRAAATDQERQGPQEWTNWNTKDPAPTKNEIKAARDRIAADTSVVQVAPNAVRASW